MAIAGGFCPLPLRLGGSDEEGWSAAQFMRATADVAAARRTRPFAIMTIEGDGSTTATVTHYRSAHGGPNPTTIVYQAPGEILITWPELLPDDHGVEFPASLTSSRITFGHGSALVAAKAEVTSRRTVYLESSSSAAFTATLVIFAEWGPELRGIGDYGGAPDKRDDESERVPYAFQWYQELGATLGSAFGDQRTGAVHAKRLATARGLMAVQRSEERLRCNATPATASALLDRWAETLLIPIAPSDPEWLTRQRCAAKFAAVAGSSIEAIENAMTGLLGDRFVSVQTHYTDALSDQTTSTPPTTLWDERFDLGDGVWASQQSHITVRVTRPGDPKDAAFRDLMHVQFPRLMSDLVPAWVTWGWSATDGGGFILGTSLLGYDGL
jgi:hypothetical protein